MGNALPHDRLRRGRAALMPGHHPTQSRRTTERKGDVRERAILDTCEALLAQKGYEDIAVSEIAEGAGITRGALYFYFGSKQEVVTALVARTVEHLWERSRVTAETDDPRQAITAAPHRTVELWNEHGPVMRTAIDLSLTVTEIGELWSRTADLFITAITAVLDRAGVQPGTEPQMHQRWRAPCAG